MQHTIIHVGLDVDDTQYHGSVLDKRTGEVIDFKCRPPLKGLLSQIDKLARHFPGCTLKLCYEASYIGFTLQRDLAEKGYACEKKDRKFNGGCPGSGTLEAKVSRHQFEETLSWGPQKPFGRTLGSMGGVVSQ